MALTSSVMQFLPPLMLILAGTVASAAEHYWDYIVVGAGPGGLQIGYFLKEANRDYMILERNHTSGSFFLKYPRHDKLISINKRNTGKTNKEFNLRHDWNSLLSRDETLQLRHYTKKFFPDRRVYHRYLNDYQQKLGIRVQFNTEVSNVRQKMDETLGRHVFYMDDQHGNIYTCKTLIVATGMGKIVKPTITGSEYIENYDDMDVNPESYEGQSVLILGRGNSAFEVADSIYGNTNNIHMIARSRVRLSWATHYVGDLRAVNNGLLDTYQLKSLDGILEGPVEEMQIVKEGGRLKLDFIPNEEVSNFDNFALREPYDRVIGCLGFQFDDSLFNSTGKVLLTHPKGRKSKFPKIHHNYESVDYPGMYFVGGPAHSLDFRKSAGGFIHGFRYTARVVHHLLEYKNHGVVWPSAVVQAENLLPYIIKRVNEVSSLYQMFEVLGDVMAIRKNGAEVEYYKDFPVNLIHQFPDHTGHQVEALIVMVMQYGTNFSGPGHDIFRSDRATGEPCEAHQSNFLHPVFHHFKELPTASGMKSRSKFQILPRPTTLHHMVEDFLTDWNASSSHILPLRRFLEGVLDQDLRHFFADDCLRIALTNQQLPPTCTTHFLNGQGIMGTEQLLLQAHQSGLML